MARKSKIVRDRKRADVTHNIEEQSGLPSSDRAVQFMDVGAYLRWEKVHQRWEKDYRRWWSGGE